MIGVVDVDNLFEADGTTVNNLAWDGGLYGSAGAVGTWKGGEGNDFLWGRFETDNLMKLYGGNGSDTIYGNYKPTVD